MGAPSETLNTVLGLTNFWDKSVRVRVRVRVFCLSLALVLHKVIFSFLVDMIRLGGLKDDYVSRQFLSDCQIVCAVMDLFGLSP